MSLDSDATESIIAHMNEDHSDAVLLYVKAFADFEAAELPPQQELTSAAMTGIDETGLDLVCTTTSGTLPLRIEYGDTGAGVRLESVAGARKLLVDMVAIARQKLG